MSGFARYIMSGFARYFAMRAWSPARAWSPPPDKQKTARAWSQSTWFISCVATLVKNKMEHEPISPYEGNTSQQAHCSWLVRGGWGVYKNNCNRSRYKRMWSGWVVTKRKESWATRSYSFHQLVGRWVGWLVGGWVSGRVGEWVREEYNNVKPDLLKIF